MRCVFVLLGACRFRGGHGTLGREKETPLTIRQARQYDDTYSR